MWIVIGVVVVIVVAILIVRSRKPIPQINGMTHIGKNLRGYEEYRHEQTGMIFVLLPGGTFQMGANHSLSEEGPTHTVKLNCFLIGKYEVTQREWQRVMGNNPSCFKGDTNPVDQVNWNDCQEFCKTAGLRLPTEAEWEYACRAGTTTKYYWGDTGDDEYMWCKNNSESTTHPVGQKKPNRCGLYDMSGNVWEWCQDWFGENYFQTSPKNNPTGPATGTERVVRGGSWHNIAPSARSASRPKLDPATRFSSNGFRAARELILGSSNE